MSARDWRGARETMERDIKEQAQKAGLDDRRAAEYAKKRAEEGCRRAEREHTSKEGRPIEVNSK
ncbi:MAG: hypothetical protein AAF721_00400 [Myxococcota bacterium]